MAIVMLLWPPRYPIAIPTAVGGELHWASSPVRRRAGIQPRPRPVAALKAAKPAAALNAPTHHLRPSRMSANGTPTNAVALTPTAAASKTPTATAIPHPRV